MIGKIYGTGIYAPSNIMDNHTLAQKVDTNDTWIRERTGIVRRHIIEDDTTVSMASKAAKEALETSQVRAEEVDFTLVSTISSNIILPCVACEVQKEIGAVNATCFDLNAACTGFLFAYNTAQAYIASKIFQTVLIIGAETLSGMVDWTDRNTCILFGDGAGAVVLKGEEGGLFSTVTHSSGKQGAALTCVPGGYIKMDGHAVFRFAVKEVSQCIQELLEKENLSSEDIDYFVLHQANRRIVESVAKRLETDLEKFPMNLQEYGNTSSASIPLLLNQMNRSGLLKKGNKIVMAGFGAGLSWGASLLEW